MAVKYLKKASKTPKTGDDETRKIVADMLADIESGGEDRPPTAGRAERAGLRSGIRWTICRAFA